jgi:surface carbohydrate biosynthesis protein (TIGR04326 family)
MANKNLLFIFDGNVNTSKLASSIAHHGIKQVDLFPLTGDLFVLQGIETDLRREGFGGLFKYDTSAIIDDQVTCLRKKICKWSADMGENKVGQKKIKEWFLLPSCNISAWWFSLLAEKNPFKTDIFLRISQACAIKDTLNKKKYDLITLAISNKDLRTAIKSIATKWVIPIKVVPVVCTKRFKERFKEFVKNAGLGIKIIRGFKLFFNFLKRKHLVSRYLPSIEKRFHNCDSVLFVSYFPLIEKIPAENGIFRNRYASALQDKLKEAGLPITWIFLYVPIDGFNLKDATRIAKGFVDKGEKLFFLEEFLTLKDIAFGLFLWIRQIFIGLFLFKSIKSTSFLGLLGKEGRPFMKVLWSESFYGPVGLEGILFVLAFKKMFKHIKNIKDCLYYCEMQPWEHALNSAKNKEQPNIRSIGFQHSSIPKNSFNYFHNPSETKRTSRYTDLPLPDIIGCNGEIMQDLLAESGYPALTRLEALRYLYLDEVLSTPVSPIQKRRTLLIAGSSDKEESIRLIMLVRFAFPRVRSFDICFKGHPLFPFEKLFNDLGVDTKEFGYTVNHDDISKSLKEAFAVVALSSTVVIEALALGCEVIVPVFPDSISLHPLVGFEKYYHKVTNKEEIRNIVEKILDGYSLCDIQEYRSFVKKYWDIDKNIPRWSKLLNINISN